MKLYYFFLVVLFCGAFGQNLVEDQRQNEVEDEGSWKVLYRLITDCAQKSDMGVCLKMKAVTFLDRAISIRAPLQVNEFVSLARDPSFKDKVGPQGRSMKPLTETQLEESLPRSMEERDERLDEMMQEKVDTFLKSRQLQLNFPAEVFEGRKKLKKGGGMLLAGGLAMAGMMAQAFMGKIALIAGKALLIAKIALVLSAVIGLKKLVGGGGGGESHQVVYATGGHEHGGWQRSFSSDPFAAHDLAYSAHKADKTNED